MMQNKGVRLEDAGKYKCVARNILGWEEEVASLVVQIIKWVKVNDNIVQARAVVKDGQLSIVNAQKKDSGLYKCEASNQLGHDLAFTQLNVVELPQFTVRPPAQLQKKVNQNITVRCQATGDPQRKVTWIKENGGLPSGRSKVSVDGTLKICNPRVEDSGKYTCIASSNEFFKSVSAMKLTVKRGKKIWTHYQYLPQLKVEKGKR